MAVRTVLCAHFGSWCHAKKTRMKQTAIMLRVRYRLSGWMVSLYLIHLSRYWLKHNEFTWKLIGIFQCWHLQVPLKDIIGFFLHRSSKGSASHLFRLKIRDGQVYPMLINVFMQPHTGTQTTILPFVYTCRQNVRQLRLTCQIPYLSNKIYSQNTLNY